MNVKFTSLRQPRQREADAQGLPFGASPEDSLRPANSHANTMGLKHNINPIGMAKKLQNWSVVIMAGKVPLICQL